MATFSTVPLDEAQRLTMPPRKATQEQYRQDVRQLSAEEAGQLELGPNDRPITERARLKAAAKAEGRNLLIGVPSRNGKYRTLSSAPSLRRVHQRAERLGRQV
jgi:hypothetical protein